MTRGMYVPGWNTTETAPLDEVVMTKIHDDDGERNVAKLCRSGNLWFLPDKSMYVYYTPTHWQRLPLTDVSACFILRRDRRHESGKKD